MFRKSAGALTVCIAIAVIVGVLTSGATAAQQKCDAKRVKVGIVVQNQSPYTKELIDGATQAAKECNASIRSAAPAALDPPASVKSFNDLVASGSKGMVVVAYPSDLWVRTINDAVKKGVIVNTIDVASPLSKAGIHAGPKSTDMGRALGAAFAAKLGPKATGEIWAGLCLLGLDIVDDRLLGFKQELAKRVPGVLVKGGFETFFDPGKNFGIWQTIIATHPDALGFAAFCEPDAGSLVKIKQQENGKYLVGNVGIDPNSLAGVKSGVSVATIGQNPFMQGYVAMKTALEQLVSMKPLPRGWIPTPIEVATSKTVDGIIKQKNSLSKGPAYSRAYFAKSIDAIFVDPAAKVKPIESYVSTK